MLVFFLALLGQALHRQDTPTMFIGNDFFREAISSCTCGGMVKKDPAEAPRSMGTTARPFRTEDRILL